MKSIATVLVLTALVSSTSAQARHPGRPHANRMAPFIVVAHRVTAPAVAASAPKVTPSIEAAKFVPPLEPTISIAEMLEGS